MAPSDITANSLPVVLHYTGYATARGGIMASLRVLAREGRFETVLGVHPEFQQNGESLPVLRLPAVASESAGPVNWWSTRRVALAVREWLAGDPQRVYHGHSRAGLLVALWLNLMGVERAISTVHVLGRQRWLYRLAVRRLGWRLHWLGPAMKRYYSITPDDWSGCLPDSVARSTFRPVRRAMQGRQFTFGAAGSLVPVKQWETLMRAAAQLGRDTEWRFVLAGAADGSSLSQQYSEKLHAMHAALGLGARWQFLGHVDGMRQFHESIDCLVLSSQWEASSMAALEAIAAGVPVLAPAQSGTSDLINTTGGGWLYSEESELVRYMRGAAEQGRCGDWHRNELGMERFMADCVAEQHAQIYRKLIA